MTRRAARVKPERGEGGGERGGAVRLRDVFRDSELVHRVSEVIASRAADLRTQCPFFDKTRLLKKKISSPLYVCCLELKTCPDVL